MTTLLAGAGGENQGLLRQDVANQPGGSVLPINNSVAKKWRDGFSGTSLSTDKWQVSQTGTGMSYAPANGALVVSTGTTVDDEISFTTWETFTVPMRGMVAVGMSQRIPGQTVWVEFVSVNDSTLAPDGVCACAWQLSSTANTNAFFEVQSSGPRLIGGAVNTTSTATPCIFELEPFSDECWAHNRALDSSSARTSSVVRHQQIPDPNRLYKLRIRVRNRQWVSSITAVANNGSGLVRVTRAGSGLTTGDSVTLENVEGVPGANGTFAVTVIDANTFDLVGSTFAGAFVNTGWATYSKNNHVLTNTAVTVPYASVTDYQELTAEITAGRGNSSGGQGIYTNTNVVGGSVGSQGISGDGSATVPSPVMVGVKGYNALPAASAGTGRQMSLMGTMVGAAVNKPFSIPESDWQFAGPTGGVSTIADVTVRAAGAAGIRNYLTNIQVSNPSATATEIFIKDGSSTVIWRGHLPANATPYDVQFITPLRGSAATALVFTCGTAGAAVYVNAQGYSAP